jgi:hypothetical protein
MAGKGKKARPFIGDQILATFQLIRSVCGLSLLSLLAAASFGLAWKPAVLTDFRKQHPSEAWRYLMDPKYTVSVGILIVVWILLSIWWTVATWRGRRFAIGLHLFFSGIAAAIGIAFGLGVSAYVIEAVIAIYAILRLMGNVGPKQVRKSRRAAAR